MITIFGAPGAGKSEQGKLLASKYGWQWISYRDLLLRLGDKDIQYAIEHGLFIDDKKASQLLQRTFASIHRFEGDSAQSIASNTVVRQSILDGFPADYRQVKWLIETKEIQSLRGAIILRVPRGELWKRLVERKRIDDTRATIERRQDDYERNITGMIRTLSANGVLVREISGENRPEDVLQRIESVLADWRLVPKKQYARIAENL